jgi:hypothetical protein
MLFYFGVLLLVVEFIPRSAERIRQLWMNRITSSVKISEFSMAPFLVPRLERAAFEIANFTGVNIAVHGSTYNRIIAEATIFGE